MEQKIDRYTLLMNVLERLSIVHDTDKVIRKGKNKLCFTLNGEAFELLKTSDKLTGKSKSIFEGANNTMKPVILYQDNEDRFTDNDVSRLTISLDRYFLSEKLGLPEKYAVCNSYYYTKSLLGALGLDLSYLLGCAKEQGKAVSDAIVLLFLAENKEKKEVSAAVFIFKNNCIEVMRFKLEPCNSAKLKLKQGSHGESYEIEYVGSTPETLKDSVEMLIGEFNKLFPASGKINFLGDG